MPHCSESSLTSRVGAKPYQSTRKEAQQCSKLSSHTKLTKGVEAKLHNVRRHRGEALLNMVRR